MKKVLALILTAAMLLSCMIVGISAVREYSAEAVVSTDKAATNTANFTGLRYNDPYFTDGYTFKIVMKSCTADFGEMAENTGFCDGVPIINMKANTIGWNNGPSLSYTFADDTWYTIEYVVDGNTTIKVNGETVGALDGAMPGNFYGSFYNSYVTEVSYISAGGDVALYEDFEDGTDDVFSTEVTTFEETTYNYVNKNVTYSKYGAATNTANFTGLRYNDPYYTDNYKFTITMKSCTADFGEMAENTGFCDGVPIINMKANTIGWNNGPSLSYTFADDTWYTIQYVVDGDTTIKVNGETVGTLDGAMPGNFYGSFYNSYVRFVGFSDGNNYAMVEDFEDGTDDVFSTELTYFSEVSNKYDLGMKYWMFHEGNSYAPIEVGNQGSNFDIEMDICLDAANSEFGTGFLGLANSPRISTSLIGVGNSTLNYTFVPGTWYHVKWDANNGSTDIYVDDAYVGTVEETATLYEGTQAFYQWVLLSIDNLSVGSYFNDMEGSALDGYQGVGMEYGFDIVEEETIFDKIEKAEVGGDAKLVENVWNVTTGNYLNWSKDVVLPTSGDYIIDFDLALLETSNRFATSDERDSYFELWCGWSVGSNVRYKIGTEYVGRDADLVLYDWGEATVDNFHRVTIEFANNRVYLYIDGVELYNALETDYNKDGGLIAMNWYCNAIIDNFQVITADTFEVVSDYGDIPLGYNGERFGGNCIKEVDLDAEDFCAENGCSVGAVDMDYDSTCYSEGQYTVYCSVCGDEKDTHEIEMKHHNWGGYDIDQKTDTGLVYIYCKNSGCVEKRYTEIPKNYTGTLYQYYDMSDDMALAVGTSSDPSSNCFDEWVADELAYIITEDGRLESQGPAMIDEWHEVSRANLPSNNWSITFDIEFDSAKDWVNEGGGFDHEGFYVRCGGNNAMGMYIGYDRIEGKLVIHKAGTKMDSASSYYAQTAYTFEDNKSYNFRITYQYEGEGYTYDTWEEGYPEYAEVAVWINGEKVLAYGTMTPADYIENDMYCSELKYSASTVPHFAFCQAGTYYLMDNLAFGSADYAVVKVAGDIDGDGELSAADALMMRQYLAGIITLEDFVDASVADVNDDGAVNAKDQLAIRIALAA